MGPEEGGRRRPLGTVRNGALRPRSRAPSPLILVVLLSLAAAAGCGIGEEASQDEGRDARPVTLHPTQPGPQHLMERPDWDVGIGFVRIPPDPEGPPGAAPPDSIWILAEPRPDAEPVGRVHHQDFRLEVQGARAGLIDGALEVAYEERALPVLSMDADGRWLEVAFALDSTGVPVNGWVAASEPRVEVVTWDDWLADGSSRGALFVRRASGGEEPPAFFAGPEEARIDIPLARDSVSGRLDYALLPLRTRDGWMQVEVATPSDACAPHVIARRDTAWIRYLDDAGRPRVWYPTRGC